MNKPWSVIDDEALELLQKLRVLCTPLQESDADVLYLRGGQKLDIAQIRDTLTRIKNWEQS